MKPSLVLLVAALLSLGCDPPSAPDDAPTDGGAGDAPLAPGEGLPCQMSIECAAGLICVDDACTLPSRVDAALLELGEVRSSTLGTVLGWDETFFPQTVVSTAGDGGQGILWHGRGPAGPVVGYATSQRVGNFPWGTPIASLALAPWGVAIIEDGDLGIWYLHRLDWDGEPLHPRVEFPELDGEYAQIYASEASVLVAVSTPSMGPYRLFNVVSDAITEIPVPPHDQAQRRYLLVEGEDAYLVSTEERVDVATGEVELLNEEREFESGGAISAAQFTSRSAAFSMPSTPITAAGDLGPTAFIATWLDGTRTDVAFGRFLDRWSVVAHDRVLGVALFYLPEDGSSAAVLMHDGRVIEGANTVQIDQCSCFSRHRRTVECVDGGGNVVEFSLSSGS